MQGVRALSVGYTPRVFPSLLNARDLGGHPTVDGDVTRRRSRDSEPAAIIEVVRCPEAAVYNMLDYPDRAGGPHAYLGRIGLDESEISRLRARLRD